MLSSPMKYEIFCHFTLSRQRERARVRVDIYVFPLTAALRHPVFLDLYKSVRDFILSPQGRGSYINK
jgi:hypothetical protein